MPTTRRRTSRRPWAPFVTDDSDGVVDLGDALEIAGVGLSEGVVVLGALRGLLG